MLPADDRRLLYGEASKPETAAKRNSPRRRQCHRMGPAARRSARRARGPRPQRWASEVPRARASVMRQGSTGRVRRGARVLVLVPSGGANALLVARAGAGRRAAIVFRRRAPAGRHGQVRLVRVVVPPPAELVRDRGDGADDGARWYGRAASSSDSSEDGARRRSPASCARTRVWRWRRRPRLGQRRPASRAICSRRRPADGAEPRPARGRGGRSEVPAARLAPIVPPPARRAARARRRARPVDGGRRREWRVARRPLGSALGSRRSIKRRGGFPPSTTDGHGPRGGAG